MNTHFDLTAYPREHEIINNVFCEVLTELQLSSYKSAEKYLVKLKRAVIEEKLFTFQELCYTSFKLKKNKQCST